MPSRPPSTLLKNLAGNSLVFFHSNCMCSCVCLRYLNSFCKVVNFDANRDKLTGFDEMKGRSTGWR